MAEPAAEASMSSPLSGGYLLIILAEPHSQEHKQILLQRLAKGRKKRFFFFYIVVCIDWVMGGLSQSKWRGLSPHHHQPRLGAISPWLCGRRRATAQQWSINYVWFFSLFFSTFPFLSFGVVATFQEPSACTHHFHKSKTQRVFSFLENFFFFFIFCCNARDALRYRKKGAAQVLLIIIVSYQGDSHVL